MDLQCSVELADALFHATDSNASFSSGHQALFFGVDALAAIDNLEAYGIVRAGEMDSC